jgi:hypothetical protein
MMDTHLYLARSNERHDFIEALTSSSGSSIKNRQTSLMMRGSNSEAPLDPPIKTYTVLSDGSILAADVATSESSSKGLNDGRKITANLFLVEGLSEPTLLTQLQTLVPGLPDGFLEAHLCDNLAQIDMAIDENQVILAKWSRAAAQRKDVWLRERRLRTSKNPFDVDHVDPVTSRLDHERYDHATKPYRSYDPIYEFRGEPRVGGDSTPIATPILDDSLKRKALEGMEGDQDEEKTPGASTRAKPGTGTKAKQNMVMHAAHECISFYHGVLENKLICKLQRILAYYQADLRVILLTHVQAFWCLTPLGRVSSAKSATIF